MVICKRPFFRKLTKQGWLFSHDINFFEDKNNIVIVRCGKCSNCRMLKYYFWQRRLQMEFKTSLDNGFYCYFITLTYNNEHYNNIYLHYVEEFQKWMKRLRKNTKSKLKYFCVVEAGIKTGRFHYHLILFSSIDIFPLQKNGHNINDKYYYNVDIKKIAWLFGFNTVSRLIDLKNLEAINYVIKYLLKNPIKYFYSKSLGYEFMQAHKYDNNFYVFNGYKFKLPGVKNFESLQTIMDNQKMKNKSYKTLIKLEENINDWFDR